MVANSQDREAYELKFNLSSSSLYVKLLQNIECVFSEKKEEEKLYLFEKEEKCEQGLMLLKLSYLLFPIIGYYRLILYSYLPAYSMRMVHL